MEWFHKYVPGFMCVGGKSHPFCNERHNMCCGIMYIFCRAQIMEGKYLPQRLVQKEYNQLGKIVSLMVRMCRPTFVSGKDVVLDIGFYVTKGITELKSKGVYSEALIKKWGCWLKVIHGDLI